MKDAASSQLERETPVMETSFSELLLKRSLLRKEVALLLAVSVRSVDRYLQQGKLTYRVTPGGQRRIVTTSLTPWLDQEICRHSKTD